MLSQRRHSPGLEVLGNESVGFLVSRDGLNFETFSGGLDLALDIVEKKRGFLESKQPSSKAYKDLRFGKVTTSSGESRKDWEG